MAPLSSGNWNNSSSAGSWYLNLNNNRTNSNNNIGFRSDSDSPRIQQWNGGTKGGIFLQVTVKSVCRYLSSRTGNCFESQVAFS